MPKSQHEGRYDLVLEVLCDMKNLKKWSVCLNRMKGVCEYEGLTEEEIEDSQTYTSVPELLPENKMKVDYIHLHLPLEYGPDGNFFPAKPEKVMPTLLEFQKKLNNSERKKFEEDVIKPLDQNFQQILRGYESVYLNELKSKQIRDLELRKGARPGDETLD
jgi:hypothetical protein